MTLRKVTLPFDILTCIADSLVDSEEEDIMDKRTLRALSLTCRAMVRPCRRHLFRVLNLSSWGKRHLNRLRRLLQGNPGIAGYVRTLYYNLCPPGVNRKAEHYILKVLRRKSLQLRCIELEGGNWEDFPEGCCMKPLLESMIHSSGITRLSLDDFDNVPLSVIALCGHLVHLHLCKVTLLGEKLSVARSKAPMLLSLTAEEESFGALKMLMARDGPNEDPLVDFSHLKEGSFQVDSIQDMHILCGLLRTATQMKKLSVDFRAPLSLVEMGKSLAAGAHRTLRFARLDICVEKENHEPLCGLALALKEFSGPENALKTLIVDVLSLSASECRTGAEDWSDLDKVLTTPGAFPNLHRVSLGLQWCFTESGRRHVIRFGDAIVKEDRFPRLCEEPSIKFDFSEHCMR